MNGLDDEMGVIVLDGELTDVEARDVRMPEDLPERLEDSLLAKAAEPSNERDRDVRRVAERMRRTTPVHDQPGGPLPPSARSPSAPS